MEDLYKSMINAVIEGEEEEVIGLVQKALLQNMPLKEILNKGLIAGMEVVGVRFKAGDMFVPEVLIAAKAMQAGSDLLKPLLAEAGGLEKKGTILIGTVKGDLHDIGKRIVAMMLEGAGFEVIDIGNDVSTEKFISAVKETNADILGMSALLTTTMVEMKEVVEVLHEEGLGGKVKVMVGGAPVTANFAKEIQAHYAIDAGAAVELATELIS